jgi:excisionase family DNA binding protein
MLRVKEIAKLAGVSAGLVYAWIEQGVLPHFRLGKAGTRGTIRVAETEFQRFLESMKHKARPQECPAAAPVKSAFRHLRVR